MNINRMNNSILASFSQASMQYLDQEGEIAYSSRNGKSSKVFPAIVIE